MSMMPKEARKIVCEVLRDALIKGGEELISAHEEERWETFFIGLRGIREIVKTAEALKCHEVLES
jgi:hypothetical protein